MNRLSESRWNGSGGLLPYLPRPLPTPPLTFCKQNCISIRQRCGGTGAVPGRQSQEKAVRRNARAALFLASADKSSLVGAKQAITLAGRFAASALNRTPNGQDATGSKKLSRNKVNLSPNSFFFVLKI